MYKELMMSAKEAEWIDNKVRVKSTVVSGDPGKKERNVCKGNKKSKGEKL